MINIHYFYAIALIYISALALYYYNIRALENKIKAMQKIIDQRDGIIANAYECYKEYDKIVEQVVENNKAFYQRYVTKDNKVH